MALMRRVVVTGVGCVSPVGGTAPATWQALSEGRCGIRKVADVPGFYDGWENPEGTGMQCLVAGAVSDDDGSFKDQSRVSRATAMALRAVDEAVRSSGDLHERLVDGGEGEEVGVAFGTGMSSLMDIAAVARNLDKGAAKRVSPFFVPKILCNAAAGQIGIRYGLHGPNHSASTACATGAHGIGDGFRLIQHGDADVMLCGGTESCLNPIAFAGFQRAKAMTTQHNETPHTASSPFAPSRSGFVMSEGAGAVVLEELEHAVRRGAPILAEVVGYGLSGDGYHVTSPHPEALGMRLCMARALREAERLGCDPSTVSYVNAHATSTPMGDELEVCKATDSESGNDLTHPPPPPSSTPFF